MRKEVTPVGGTEGGNIDKSNAPALWEGAAGTTSRGRKTLTRSHGGRAAESSRKVRGAGDQPLTKARWGTPGLPKWGFMEEARTEGWERAVNMPSERRVERWGTMGKLSEFKAPW